MRFVHAMCTNAMVGFFLTMRRLVQMGGLRTVQMRHLMIHLMYGDVHSCDRYFLLIAAASLMCRNIAHSELGALG